MFWSLRTIDGLHRLWDREGLWKRTLTMISRKTRDRIRLVDGTDVVVHQCAANSAGGTDKQAKSKTREGRDTKIMALIEGRGLAVNLLLVEGQAYEGSPCSAAAGKPYKTVRGWR